MFARTKSFIKKTREAGMRMLGLGLLTATGGAAFGEDQVIDNLDLAADSGGELTAAEVTAMGGGAEMTEAVGDQVNAVVLLIFGPGMFVVMAIAAVIAVFGFMRGNKEALWIGVATFVLAATLRALMPIFIG